MLKIYKDKDYAIMPQLATQGSACFDVHAVFELGARIRAYNPWNKQIDIVSKPIAERMLGAPITTHELRASIKLMNFWKLEQAKLSLA